MNLIEQVREFWDSRPCNIRHSPKMVGTLEYFDEVEARKYKQNAVGINEIIDSKISVDNHSKHFAS